MSEARAGRGAQGRVGTVINGKWQVDARIGSGGMATVYAATHRNGHRAALKMLHAGLSRDPATRARFLREGYVANKVAHPGVVAVLDDGVAEDGAAFLVLELLEGETLEARRERLGGKLPVDDALNLADQALDALAAAHEKGIIHRDVKPENVFLTKEGQLKLLDFGLARMLDFNSEATKTGVTIGTPEFMPPEQAMGRRDAIDARSDVWGLGATLFTLITGKFVHDAQTIHEQLIAAATRRSKPIRQLAPHVTPEVAIVIDRALELEMNDRWSSAREMQTALREARGETTNEFNADSLTQRTASPLESDSFIPIDSAHSSNKTTKFESRPSAGQRGSPNQKLEEATDLETTFVEGSKNRRRSDPQVPLPAAGQPPQDRAPDPKAPFRRPLQTPSADHDTFQRKASDVAPPPANTNRGLDDAHADTMAVSSQQPFPALTGETMVSPGLQNPPPPPRRSMPVIDEIPIPAPPPRRMPVVDEVPIPPPPPRRSMPVIDDPHMQRALDVPSHAFGVSGVPPDRSFQMDATVASPGMADGRRVMDSPMQLPQASPRAFHASAPPPPPTGPYNPVGMHAHSYPPPPPMAMHPQNPNLVMASVYPQPISEPRRSSRFVIFVALGLIVLVATMGAFVLYNRGP